MSNEQPSEVHKVAAKVIADVALPLYANMERLTREMAQKAKAT